MNPFGASPLQVCLSGAPLALSYYGLPERTGESFSEEEGNGKRWFRTGDIGEFDANGGLLNCILKKSLSPKKISSIQRVEKARTFDSKCILSNHGKNIKKN